MKKKKKEEEAEQKKNKTKKRKKKKKKNAFVVMSTYKHGPTYELNNPYFEEIFLSLSVCPVSVCMYVYVCMVCLSVLALLFYHL